MGLLKTVVKTFLGDLRRAFVDLSVVIGIVAFFQFVVLRSVPSDLPQILMGLAIVGVGLALFMRGLEVGLFPLGERLAKHLSASSSRLWIVLFAFIIGFATTIAEPALIAIAHKAAVISGGQIDALILRLVVALAVGLAIVLGVLRIIFNHPIHWYIISGYALVLGITYFAPVEIVGLAYDLGGVTTSTVTVPLIAALGIGLAASLKGRNPIIDGFGLIAFASLTPMIFVQLYGIVAYKLGAAGAVESVVATTHAVATSSIVGHIQGLLLTFLDVLPVILAIVFFYYVVLRQRIEQFKERALGFALVIVGLYAFVVGLETGLFPVGETIAQELALLGDLWIVYIFAFTMGFATTIAEPSLTAIARKAEEVSGGAMRALVLRAFVAVGVGFGILLGAYRIVQGDSIVWYVMVGYAVVVIMTYLAPRTIIPIAYDSGGVTTSTITVPIVAALGLGLASTIPGRDPLIDGFGLIAFASLFPMIAVLGYGISKQGRVRQHERKLRKMGDRTLQNVLDTIHAESETEKAKGAVHLMLHKKPFITMSGDTSSGVSTAARGVAETLHYRYFSTGELFRTIAEKNDMTIEELSELAETNSVVDNEIDQLIMVLGQKERDIVLDSRLAHWWVHAAFKVYLRVDSNIAAERVFAQAQDDACNAQHTESIEDIRSSLDNQKRSREKRYQDFYGLDITNMNQYNIIIDTSHKKPKQVIAEIVDAYREWLQKT